MAHINHSEADHSCLAFLEILRNASAGAPVGLGVG